MTKGKFNADKWHTLGKELLMAPLTNDFVFYNVMRRENFAAHIVAMIDLAFKEDELALLQEQKPIDPAGDVHGIRMDMFLENVHGDMFDIEMQRCDNHDTPHRTSYYHGVLRTEMLSKGQSYIELRRTCVIMITMYDYFGDGKAIHKITSKSDDGHDYEDLQTTYLVYPSGDLNGLPPDLQDFLKLLIEQPTSNGEFITRIKEAMTFVKTNRKMRYDFMRMRDKIMDEVNDAVADAVADARIEALKEGREEERKENFQIFASGMKLLKQGFNSQEISAKLLAQYGESRRQEINDLVLLLK